MNSENKNLNENAPVVQYPRQQIQLPFEKPLNFSLGILPEESIPDSNQLLSVERPLRYLLEPLIVIKKWSISDIPGFTMLDKTFTDNDFRTYLNARATSELDTHLEYTGELTIHIERKRNIQHQGIFAVCLLPPTIFHSQVDKVTYKQDNNIIRLINYFGARHYNASGNSTISVPIPHSDLFARHIGEHDTGMSARPISRLVVIALTPLRTTSEYTDINFKISTTWENVTFNVLRG